MSYTVGPSPAGNPMTSHHNDPDAPPLHLRAPSNEVISNLLASLPSNTPDVTDGGPSTTLVRSSSLRPRSSLATSPDSLHLDTSIPRTIPREYRITSEYNGQSARDVAESPTVHTGPSQLAPPRQKAPQSRRHGMLPPPSGYTISPAVSSAIPLVDRDQAASLRNIDTTPSSASTNYGAAYGRAQSLRTETHKPNAPKYTSVRNSPQTMKAFGSADDSSAGLRTFMSPDSPPSPLGPEGQWKESRELPQGASLGREDSNSSNGTQRTLSQAKASVKTYDGPRERTSSLDKSRSISTDARQRAAVERESTVVEAEDECDHASDTDETKSVRRRIRELKAAKQERLKVPGNGNDESASTTPGTSPQLGSEQWTSAGSTIHSVTSEPAAVPSINVRGIDQNHVVANSRPPSSFSRPRQMPPASQTAFARAMSLDVDRTQSMDTASLPGRRPNRWSQEMPPPGAPSLRRQFSNSSRSQRRRPSTAYSEVPGPPLDPIDLSIDEFLASPRFTQRIPIVEERRMVAFSEVGDPEGHPVFCCVGMGMTRYVMAFYDELATSLKLRILTPDRPGIGDSDPCQDGLRTPLRWVDDISAICAHLNIEQFSLFGHSAGAIYALATALRIPHQVRGTVHLLATFIPPSQLSSIGLSKQAPRPTGSLPRSQRLLRVLPTPFLRAANASFMGATSSSLFGNKTEGRTPRRSLDTQGVRSASSRPSTAHGYSYAHSIHGDRPPLPSGSVPIDHFMDLDAGSTPGPQFLGKVAKSVPQIATPNTDPAELQKVYNQRLIPRIWELATKKSSPAIDLMTCLERNREIGFRYVDIYRHVVLHHGSKDNRVPVENVKWLGKVMRNAEVRILDGQGHDLMSNATVMSSVLTEISREAEADS